MNKKEICETCVYHDSDAMGNTGCTIMLDIGKEEIKQCEGHTTEAQLELEIKEDEKETGGGYHVTRNASETLKE